MRPITYVVMVVLLSGCTIKPPEVSITSEKTALESQIMGTYSRITEDLWMITSERGPAGDSAASFDSDRLRAVRALQRQQFNADEVSEFLSRGAFGEGNDGRVGPIEQGMSELPPRDRQVAETVLREENEDRETLMIRVIEVNDNLSDADLPAVRRTFAARNRTAAPVGAWVQNDDGLWVRKPAGAQPAPTGN